MSDALPSNESSVPIPASDNGGSEQRPPTARANQAPPKGVTAVGIARDFGVVVALIGMLIGLVMAGGRTVARCADGTYFPQGTTDFTCYDHPQAGTGLSLAVVSVLLGIIVVLVSIPAAETVRARG